MLIPLVEITLSPAPRVDRDAGVIRGVKILGRESKNGRTYSDAALNQAARMYAGRFVNLNHPGRHEAGAERAVEEGFGWLEGVEVQPDGVYGDLHFFKSHPQAAVICEAAERNPLRFGLSHNAQGRVARRQGKVVVESIESVRSVDIVQHPATCRGLFESEELMQRQTARQIVEGVGGSLVKLFEDQGLAALADAPADAPPQAGSDEQLKAAFRGMIVAAFDDESLDFAATLAKIRDLLKAYYRLAEPAGDAGPLAPADASESTRPAAPAEPGVSQLIERLERLEAQSHCRALLEAAGRSCDAARLEALVALPGDAQRQALIESWPERQAAGGHPRPAVSRPLVESASDSVVIPQSAQALALALR